LNDQVAQATQDTINQLNATGGSIDTMEEFNQVQKAMLTHLDASVANIAIANSTERQQILDKYTAIQAQGEAFNKNLSIVNEPISKAKGFYIDGNGNPMVDQAGNTIAYKPEYQTSFDQSTNTLTSRDPSDPAGTLKQTPIGNG